MGEEKLPSLLEKFHRDITLWIPKRKGTIEELQQALDSINKAGKVVNLVKCVGSLVSVASGIVSGILGLAARFSTEGLATPSIVVSAAGIGGAVASGGADVVKAVIIPKLYKESMTSKYKNELDYYMTVIEQAAQLHYAITKKSQLSYPHAKIDVKTNTARVAGDLLTTYSFIRSYYVIQIAEAAAEAAAEVTVEAVQKSSSLWNKLPARPTLTTATKVTSEIINTSAQLASLNVEGIANSGNLLSRGYKYVTTPLTSNKAIAIECITEAADTAAHNTLASNILASAFVSEGTTQAIVKAASTAAGETAEALAKAETKEVALALAKKSATPAAKAAGRTVFAESVEATAKATGEAVAKSTGSSLKTVGNTAMEALPLLNFGFAAWDTYEAAKAGYEIIHGTEQEKLLQKKIQELKEEANLIVEVIYNYLADLQSPPLPHIDIPFPECKI